MLLTPALLRSLKLPQPHELRFDLHPVQAGLLGSPWHVCIASILTPKDGQHRPHILKELFNQYPNPLMLSISDEHELQDLLRPLGFHRTRARYLQRISWKWDAGGWEDLRELPGVSEYVAACVELFCFDPVFKD